MWREIIIKFIYGCAGSLLLCRFSLAVVSKGPLCLQCSGFLLRRLLLLWSMGSSARASVVASRGLLSCGSWALEHRLAVVHELSFSVHVGSFWIRD